MDPLLSQDDAFYLDFLNEVKSKVLQVRTQAMLSVNWELIVLYWQLGWEIFSRQNDQGWGSKVVDRLSWDLKVAFLEMKGFSRKIPLVHAVVC